MRVTGRTLTGSLSMTNRGAFHWGVQGLIAYGCHNAAVVVDPESMQVLQTLLLDKNKGIITKVKWARETYHHSVVRPYWLHLVTADSNGRIVLWDVQRAVAKMEFHENSKAISEVEWILTDSEAFLLSLHPGGLLVLWNALTGARVWKKSYTENLLTFVIDPFDGSHVACLGIDFIFFIDDVSTVKMPASAGRKLFISTSNAATGKEAAALNAAAGAKSRTNLTQRMTNILIGESSKSASSGMLVPQEHLQICFHRSCRHHLLLVYPREVLVLDLLVNQTMSVVPLERSGSPFFQVETLRQRDAIACIHENGSISIRVRRLQHAEDQAEREGDGELQPMTPHVELVYDLRCQSDGLRITKHNRVLAFGFNPISELNFAVVTSENKVLIFQIDTIDYTKIEETCSTGPALSPLYTPDASLTSAQLEYVRSAGLGLGHMIKQPKTSLEELIGHVNSFSVESERPVERHGIQLRLSLVRMASSVLLQPTILRMCPPLTTRNWNDYQPLVAIGNAHGAIQVFNLNGNLEKEFGVHTCTVILIEWVSLHSFLSVAISQPSTSGLVKNEVFFTDIKDGQSFSVRQGSDEESPIQLLKVSTLKFYFILKFKSHVCEIWDLQGLCLLRQLPINASFSAITALEWSPQGNSKINRKKDSSDMSDFPTSSSFNSLNRVGGKSSIASLIPERFMCTNNDGGAVIYTVEGSVIHEGQKMTRDGNITSIAWKNDIMVLGDADGTLSVVDIKQQMTRLLATHRGHIKKLKFAPGRGNMKLLVLFQDGADIWDLKEMENYSSVRCPRDMARMLDADWAASDKPIFLTSEGFVRVGDLHFRNCMSVVDSSQGGAWCPYLLEPKTALTLKTLLQHQPWQQYQLAVPDEQLDELCKRELEVFLKSIPREMAEFLPVCSFGTARRCQLVARMFGDEHEIEFWTIALHYLRDLKSRKTGTSSSVEDWGFMKEKSLEKSFDLLCDNSLFKNYQLERAHLHDSRRCTPEQTRSCANQMILLGQTDRAVQLLLETDPTNANYYSDSLQACLLASIKSSEPSQSTIKLVATNLIAHGRLQEGVQLLCLIDKGLDACRYLQTYGKWDQAAWLAKATLSEPEWAQVGKRWAEHLVTTGQNSQAVLILMMLGNVLRVLQVLQDTRCIDVAVLFIEACTEFHLLPESPEMVQLTQAIMLDYGRSLVSFGLHKAAEFYFQKAGSAGELAIIQLATNLQT